MKKLKSENARVLIIGGGGREHSIGVELASISLVEEVFFLPGNGGTAMHGKNLSVSINDFEEILNVVKNHNIDLIVVGPEEPLANGIVDFFREKEIPIVGPTKAAARIESSKIFARLLMSDADIPQPGFLICKNRDTAEEAINFFNLPVVLKVDGLAAGKGAFVCKNINDIEEAINAIYISKKFGEGDILVEECLKGQEMSVFMLCSENDYAIIGTAQDYKRLLDGDEGPNTGGMGSIAPSPLIEEFPDLMEKIEKAIIRPTLQAMRDNGTPFTGFLYAGLMITDGEPSVIEFNCRLGDPETQVILPLIKNNFFKLLWKAANNLDLPPIKKSDHLKSAAFVIKVADGYPNAYQKGQEIIIDDTVIVNLNCFIVHAGTKSEEDKFFTNGGRVIGLLGFGGNLEDAVQEAYKGIEAAKFPGEFYRKDIGKF